MERRITFKILRIFIILNIFSSNTFAQSKHVSIWCLDNYIINFNKSIIQPEEHNDNIGTNLYVDSEGKIQLILKDGILYDENYKPIKTNSKIPENDEDYSTFFVPSPGNNNFIYYFRANNYILIDIEKNEVIGEVQSLNELSKEENLILFNHILVHHSNCKDIWLIYYSNDIMYKYLITASGIEFKGIVHIEREITNPKNKYDMIVNLSSDCKHYTANFLYDSIVCYGDFDRLTGNFERKSEKIISARSGIEQTYILNSIISRDNKKIYYLCESKPNGYTRFIEILSANIINGKPDYENISTIYSENFKSGLIYTDSDIFYGYDGNIYIIHYHGGKMYKLMSATNEKTLVEEFLIFKNENSVRSEDFLADWFSKKQCGENTPCSEIKKPKIICE